MSDFTSAQPTPAQLQAAGLVAVTTYEEIEAAYANGQGPLRSYNAATEKFPPVTSGYVAKPKPVDVTITFNSEGGSAVNSITIPVGTSIEEPVTTYAGYTFDGWFTADGELIAFPYVPSGSVTLVAKWTAVVVPTTTLNVGINNAGTLLYAGGEYNVAQLAQAKALGAKFTRSSVPWNCTLDSGSWGTLFTSATDLSLNQKSVATIKNFLAQCEAVGIQPIFCTAGVVAPAGTVLPAIANDLYSPGFPFTPQAYASIMAELCAAVPGLWFENINEWDLYNQSYSAGYAISVSTYAELLQLTYPAVKAADSTSKVMMGPLANVNPGNENGYTMLTNLYSILPNWFDFVDADSIHGLYVWPGNLSPSQYGVVGIIEGWLALRAKYGNTKPWYITEDGWLSLTTNSGDSSPEMTPALQAQYLVAVIQELEQFVAQGLEGFLIYCLTDGDSPWGLIESDGKTLKPSFTAVQALIATLTQLGAS